MIGPPMLRLIPIIIAFMYIVIVMAYTVVYAVTHPDASLDAAANYALLWPLRVYRDLF